jgi:Zn-dependent peptidase ImmA (M78 family)/DNA-binding XRE family transcriptional regulator
MAKSWEDLGKRVMLARKERGLTQLDLANTLQFDRTVVTKIEAGQRTVDTFELAQLARVLRRPIGWFVVDPSPSVVSRRAGREDVIRREDVQLEALALDVEQLVEIGVLHPTVRNPTPIESIAAAEQAALEARRTAGLAEDEAVWDLVRIAEKLGLYAFVLELHGADDTLADGSYVALRQGGVALISGGGDSGRRRFTLAHELGHHVLADEYAAEWVVESDSTDAEKVINAFAIHFLLPRSAVNQRWQKFRGETDPRDAAIRIAVEFGVSWSAVCAQLSRIGCLSRGQFRDLEGIKPTNFDFAERELQVRNDVVAPLVPPGYAAAVVRALRRAKIGPARALELLHGTILERDLPPEPQLSLESMTAELEVLPD